jgi:hypothetical protein
MFPPGIALIVIARGGAGSLKHAAVAGELVQAASNLAARLARQAR